MYKNIEKVINLTKLAGVLSNEGRKSPIRLDNIPKKYLEKVNQLEKYLTYWAEDVKVAPPDEIKREIKAELDKKYKDLW